MCPWAVGSGVWVICMEITPSVIVSLLHSCCTRLRCLAVAPSPVPSAQPSPVPRPVPRPVPNPVTSAQPSAQPSVQCPAQPSAITYGLPPLKHSSRQVSITQRNGDQLRGRVLQVTLGTPLPENFRFTAELQWPGISSIY